MTDNLPLSLQQFGAELERAGRREFEVPATRQRRTFRAVAASTMALAAVGAMITFAVSATTSTSRAYALTRNDDGTITVTLDNLATGIPQLNARFAQLGIDETVIPVKAGCTTPGLVADPGAELSDTLTLTPAPTNPNSNVDYFLAAERLPDGSVGLSIGATSPPLPSCFSPILLTVKNGS
jgi:hypothetical protein